VDLVTRDASTLHAACREDVLPDPRAPAARLLEELVETSRGDSPEAILDGIYLATRMQRFAGRNFTTTGFFCRPGLPYFGNELVDTVSGLPGSERHYGHAMRNLLVEISPALASVPLDSGRPVRLNVPPQAGVAAVRSPPSPTTIPWHSVLGHGGFGSYVRDLLCSSSTRVREFFAPERLEVLVDTSLGGGPTYPLGLVMTLELTLRLLATSRTIDAPRAGG
jgi:hypothetical protein